MKRKFTFKCVKTGKEYQQIARDEKTALWLLCVKFGSSASVLKNDWKLTKIEA